MNSSAPTGTAVVSSTVATAGIVTDTAKDRSDDIDEALEEDPDVEQRNILSVASATMPSELHSIGACVHSIPNSSPSEGLVTSILNTVGWRVGGL